MNRILLSAFAAAALAFAQGPAFAADHYKKIAEDVHVNITYQCILFRLTGVETADPVYLNEPWFGLRRDHPAFAELFAILLTGAAGKRSLNVHTQDRACGAAGIHILALN